MRDIIFTLEQRKQITLEEAIILHGKKGMSVLCEDGQAIKAIKEQ